MRALRLGTLVFGAGFLALACSVINALDDVAPANDGAASGGGGNSSGGSSGGKSGGGSGGKASGGSQNPGGAGGDGPTEPTTGLIVAAGVDEADTNVIVTLDPDTGSELSREDLSGAAVAGLVYDGTPDKNLWYVFTATEFPADPMSKADLEVREHDDSSPDDPWTTIAQVTALPPPRPGTFLVLNDRLAYLSYVVRDGGLVDSITILDTSDPEDIQEIDFAPPAFSGEALGLVGSRGAPGDIDALGGTLTIATGDGCTGTRENRNCDALTLLPIFVGNSVTAGLTQSLGAFRGEPAFASAVTEQAAFVALPSASATGTVTVYRFNPRDPNADGDLATPSDAHWVGGIAYAECQTLSAFSAVLEQEINATSGTGITTSRPLGRTGQGVVYEPYFGHVIAPFNPNNDLYPTTGDAGAGNVPTIDSYALSLSGVNVMLAKRTAPDWDPPADVAANLVAARFPTSFTCP